jgi:hypothetical protein
LNNLYFFSPTGSFIRPSIGEEGGRKGRGRRKERMRKERMRMEEGKAEKGERKG